MNAETVKEKILDLVRATDDLEDLARREGDQATKKAILEGELKAIEASMGEVVLSGTLAGDDGISKRVMKQITEKRVALEISEKVLVAFGPRIAAARKAVATAKADVLKAEAGRLEAEVARRQNRTSKLLMDLVDFEGAEYIPGYLLEQATAQAFRGAYADPRPPKHSMPKTDQFLARARGLRDAAAAILENRPEPVDFQTGLRLAPWVIDFETFTVDIPEPERYELRKPEPRPA